MASYAAIRSASRIAGTQGELGMTILLPTHDGIADYAAGEVPEAAVVRYQGAETPGLDDVTFYCLPYLGDDAARDLLARLPSLRVVQSLSSGVDDLLGM